MTADEVLGEIRGAVQELESAVGRFTTVLGPPVFIVEEGNERFRYTRKDSVVVQVLKSVRVVSGLNALIALLEVGHVQEMGVLLRTVDDFLAEIVFLQEAHERGANAAHQKFIDSYFANDDVNVSELLVQPPKRDDVPRKKIQASEARHLNPENPDRMRKIVKTVDDVFSGYVHGGYRATMELYVGGEGAEGFQLRGMLGSPRIPAFRRQIATYVHRALNVFAYIAGNMGMQDLFDRLLATRRRFEVSSAYADRTDS